MQEVKRACGDAGWLAGAACGSVKKGAGSWKPFVAPSFGMLYGTCFTYILLDIFDMRVLRCCETAGRCQAAQELLLRAPVCDYSMYTPNK